MSTTQTEVFELIANNDNSNSTTTSLAASRTTRDDANARDTGYGGDDDANAPLNAVEAIPNGGYGWTVVFACSVITFLFNGWSGAWGVLQTALLQSHLTQVSTSTLSFVGSLCIALCVALGLFSVRLSRLIGARWSMVLGVSLFSVGILCSSFTPNNVGGLFMTAGVATGFGTSLLYAMCNTLPVQWFSTRLGTANGLVKLGGGLGGTILSLVLQALLDRVGIAWTFRILGLAFLGVGVPAALLVRERHSPSSVGAGGTASNSFIDLSLFKSLPFTSLFCAGAIGTFALFVPPFFLPLFAHSIGLSAQTGAAIVAAFNACTAVGRFSAGFACDRFGSTNILLVTMSLNALSMLAIWPVSNTLAPLVCFAAINGVANGAFFVSMPTTIVYIVGPGRGAVGMGMAITGWTGGYLMGSPIAGMLIASTGAAGTVAGEGSQDAVAKYRSAIFYAGGVALASACFVLLARLRMDRKLFKKL